MLSMSERSIRSKGQEALVEFRLQLYQRIHSLRRLLFRRRKLFGRTAAEIQQEDDAYEQLVRLHKSLREEDLRLHHQYHPIFPKCQKEFKKRVQKLVDIYQTPLEQMESCFL